jgi:NAD(P)-dependent dehydrogenase (short-subunit alcohol dehydrogenase family)
MGRLAGKIALITEEVVAAGGAMSADAPVDLADPNAAAAWVNGAVERAGGIDILYNNASAPWVGPFEEMTFEDWRFTQRNELDGGKSVIS